MEVGNAVAMGLPDLSKVGPIDLHELGCVPLALEKEVEEVAIEDELVAVPRV